MSREKYIIAVIFIMFPLSAYPLAPPPINFTDEVVNVDDRKLHVTFDGEKIRIEETEQDTRVKPYFPIIILASIFFWSVILGYYLWRSDALLDGFIVLLAVVLISHVVYTIFKKS